MYKLSDMMLELMASMHAQQKEYEAPQLTETILSSVARALSLKVSDIVSPSRKSELAEARQIISFILEKHSTLSFREIGQILGGRDHSTILVASRTCQDHLHTKDKKFMAKIELVKAELSEGLCI